MVLALAAGIVGVVLALSAKDEGATKDEVRALRDQVEVVQEETSKATEEDVGTLTDRLDELEGRVTTIAPASEPPRASSRWSRTTSTSCAVRSLSSRPAPRGGSDGPAAASRPAQDL